MVMKLKPSLKPTDSIMNKLSPTTLLLALTAFTFALTAEPLSATPGLQEQMTEPDGLTVDTSAVLNQVLDHQVALNQTLDHHLVAHTSNPDLTEVTTEAEGEAETRDRKSTRLNSSHVAISYAVFCLKKKKLKLEKLL